MIAIFCKAVYNSFIFFIRGIHMIQTIQLQPGVTLRCFPDNRFKQSCLTLQFLRPLCQEEAAMNALIPAILLRGCKSAPDLRAITLRLDDLYGASIGALVRKVGDYQTTGFACGFISDHYTLEGDRLLEPMVDFIRELLLEPVTENGAFSQDFVESEKKNLISTIESQLNNKRSYAMAQMMALMCKDDPFGTPRLGTVKTVQTIDADALYRHYQKVLCESPVELFYVGEEAPEKVAAALSPLFEDLQRNVHTLPQQTPFRGGPADTHEETMDVAQGKLVLGFTTPTTIRDEGFAAMQVFNTIFGSGMTSKLFMNIREKMSLCYDIGSGYHGSKGIIAVASGIDFDKDTLVIENILKQLNACRQGHITEEELVAAKEALCTGLRSTHDSPGAIENYYASGALSGLNMTPQQYMDKVCAVTVQDVAQAAKTLQLHTQYFLKGEA